MDFTEYQQQSEIPDVSKYIDDVRIIKQVESSSSYPVIKLPYKLTKAANVFPGKREYDYKRDSRGLRIGGLQQTNNVIDDKFFSR